MHLPDDLAAELRQWQLECPDPSPDAFMFPNADGGFMDTSNYRTRVLKPLADSLGYPEAELPGDTANHRHKGTEFGLSKGYSIALAALTSGHHGERVHAEATGESAANGRNGLCAAHQRRGLQAG